MPRYRIDAPDADGCYTLGRFSVDAAGLADMPAVEFRNTVNLQDVSVEFPVKMKDLETGGNITVLFAFTGKLSRGPASATEERKLDDYKASSTAEKKRKLDEVAAERQAAINQAESVGRERGADFAAAKLAQAQLQAQADNAPKPLSAGDILRQAAETLKAARAVQEALEE